MGPLIDREKVIKEWEAVLSRDPLDAPWDLIDDTLTLLKEQEAVEPYMDYDGRDVWRCGKCGAKIFHIHHDESDEDCKSYAKFCRHCGQAVNWCE